MGQRELRSSRRVGGGVARRKPENSTAGRDEHGLLQLQRSAGNAAATSLVRGAGPPTVQLVQRAIGEGAKAGQMVKHVSDGKLYTIKKAGFDEGLGEWGYTVESETERFLVPASNRDFGRVEPKEQFLAIGKDPEEDFTQAVKAASPDKLNALLADTAFLNKMRSTLTSERFGLLAASILLISKYAPAARDEALRVLSTMYGDKGTAFRMLSKPVKTVIVPRDKQMTELDEFKSLLKNDSGKGKGKTFDGRWWAHTRGVGDVTVGGTHYAAITEENLLGGDAAASVFDAPRGLEAGEVGEAGTVVGGYTPGYSTSTHEMAHAIHRYGLRGDQKDVIKKAYAKKRAATKTKATIGTTEWSDGPRVAPKAPASWAGYTDDAYLDAVVALDDNARRPYENYASQNDEEYFAQAVNAYFGTNTGVDTTTEQPRNNGKGWVEANEPELFTLLEELFKGKVVNELAADGKLKAGGTCTNPPPQQPAPAPHHHVPIGPEP
jgi:hypothetical protein